MARLVRDAQRLNAASPRLVWMPACAGMTKMAAMSPAYAPAARRSMRRPVNPAAGSLDQPGLVHPRQYDREIAWRHLEPVVLQDGLQVANGDFLAAQTLEQQLLRRRVLGQAARRRWEASEPRVSGLRKFTTFGGGVGSNSPSSDSTVSRTALATRSSSVLPSRRTSAQPSAWARATASVSSCLKAKIAFLSPASIDDTLGLRPEGAEKHP